MTRQGNELFEELNDVGDLFSTNTTGDGGSNKQNFSSVDMIHKYVLNPPSMSTDIGAFDKPRSSRNDGSSLAIQTSSVSTFPLSGLGSLSSLFGSSVGASNHGGVDSAENNSPPKRSKIQEMKALMDSKMPAAVSSRSLVMDSKKPAASSAQLVHVGAPATVAVHPVDNEAVTSSPYVASSIVGRRTEASPTEDDYIKDEPNENDVLLGRGGRSNQHPGNARYLQAKIRIQPRYRAASKDAKKEISQELVDTVKVWGGRFLKLDENSQRWYVVDNRTARVKASQALREDNTEESRRLKRTKYLNSKRKSPPE